MNFQVPRSAFAPALRIGGQSAWLKWSRQSLRKPLMIGVPLLVGAILLVGWLSGGRYVSTDDSYIHAAKLVVSSDVSGLVSDVYVHEGQRVRKSEALFRIDPKQFQIAV